MSIDNPVSFPVPNPVLFPVPSDSQLFNSGSGSVSESGSIFSCFIDTDSDTDADADKILFPCPQRSNPHTLFPCPQHFPKTCLRARQGYDTM